MRKPLHKLFQLAIVTSSLLLVSCSDRPRPQTGPPQTIPGPLDLYYTLQTSPSTTAGTGTKPEKASAIHFHDTYIVVEDTESGGRILPIDKLKHFTWRR